MDELVRKALAFEEKGQQLYEKLAEESTHRLAQTLFENLAIDEQYHAKWIHELHRSLGGEEGSTDASCVARRKPLEKRMREAFERLQMETDPPDSDNVKGLVLAMKLEEEALALYREILDEDPSPRETAFLEKILEEEWKHLEALRNVHAYLTNTGDWFDVEESGRWNWMNL